MTTPTTLETPPETVTALTSDLVAFYYMALERAPTIGFGLFCFIALFFLARPISKFVIRPINHLSKSQLMTRVTRRVISFIIVMLGLYIFLRLAGLTQFAIAMISGTGLIGLVVGFAFKDIAENFIASLLLSVQKPFKIGDVLEVAGHVGVVNQVTSRATILVDFDGNHIQIPNATIYKSTVKNFTANPKMRSHFVIGIGYDASVTKSQEIILEVLTQHPAVLKDPDPQVLIDNLGSSTINLHVYFWVDCNAISVLKAKSALQKAALVALEAAQISMPDDARERIIINQSTQTPISSEKSDQHDISESETAIDDDLTTEITNIKEQAKHSRSPEGGQNIL